jgi:DNA-binding NarL/FixJ family response regulator
VTTILIVDDHAVFRAEVRRLLERSGFVVLGEAADGRAAVKAALALRPDAILLDIGLPDVSGFAVVDELRDRGVEARIVLASSRDAASYGERIADSRAAGFVQKADLTGDVVLGLVGEPPAA